MLAPFGASAQICSAPARRGTGGDADENAFLLRQILAALQRVRAGDAQDLMRSCRCRPHRRVSFGMKSGAQPCIGCGLNAGCAVAGEPSGLRCWPSPLLSIAASAGSQTTILVFGISLAQHARDTLQRAAGAVAGDPVVELRVLEVLDDLARRGARVHVGVGLVLELAGEEPAMRLGQFIGLVHHAHAALARPG